MGIAKLIDANLCWGLLYNQLKLGKTHGKVNSILGGPLERLGICPTIVEAVLFDRNDRASFYHHLVGIVPQTGCLILVHEGGSIRMKHIGTWCLVGSLKGLKIFPNGSQGLFTVNRVPPWMVFPVEVIVMLLLP